MFPWRNWEGRKLGVTSRFENFPGNIHITFAVFYDIRFEVFNACWYNTGSVLSILMLLNKMPINDIFSE